MEFLGQLKNSVMMIMKRFPRKYIEFDNEQVGKEARGKHPCLKPGLEKATPIEPEEDKVSSDGGVRRQFPIRLAWACTVHKVQGLTVNKAVVSKKRYLLQDKHM